jgi:hypothetical protein
MDKGMKIEVEDRELFLVNEAGDKVIIPKDKAAWVKEKLKEGCHGCIDKLVETLPVMEDYADDGSLIPDDKKKITFKYKPYTAVQATTYVAPKVITSLKQKEKIQFAREQPVLKADTRTEQQRKRAQEYTESVLNPSISTQIGEALQKPLRWLADPVKGVGDIVSAIAPNSALAKNLPNTNEDVFEYRKKQLNPYTSNKEKINNTINEAVPLTNQALLNILPVEAAAGNMIKSSKNLIKPASKLSKSKYAPSNAKYNLDNYISINDDEFIEKILLKGIELNLQDNETVPFSGYAIFNTPTGATTGNFRIGKGSDERGEYFSYYDLFDIGRGDEKSKTFGTAKPFEVYDRIYIKDYGDGQKKRMYYTDKELSELDVNKKNFDTLALQRELRNRGYKLPKSTKKDGSLDGVWGDETKNALLDWQNKNKNKIK